MSSFLTGFISLPGPYSERARIEAVTRLSQITKSAAIGMMLLPAPIVAALWGEVPSWWLLSWWAVLLFVYGGQYLLVRNYESRWAHSGPPDFVRARNWARRMYPFVTIDGLAWGALSMLILAVDSPSRQLLVLVITVGYPFATLFGTSFWPALQYLFMLPLIGLTMLALMLKGDHGSLGLMAAFVLDLLILHSMVRKAHSSTMNGIHLQFENLDLVKQLHAEKEKAVDANFAKSKFLAVASHDLRQPLHAMTLLADALTGRLQNANDGLVLARLQESLSSMRKLFNALLDISRLDAGIVEARIKDVQLSTLLDRLQLDYAPQAADKNLEWRCQPTRSIVQTDPVLLETLLRNLISNALRYTPQGYVAITCREAEGWVRIEVEDSGIGIPAEKQTEIFREFHQLSNLERDGVKGLGLGLAIVDRLVHLLNHRLELRSTPGVGSCFSILAPLGRGSAVLADAHIQTDADPALGTDLTGMVVLVIDDQTAVLDGMQALLGSWGCEVLLADSESAAVVVTTQAQRPLELIITDYRLREGRTGSQAIDHVRREFGESIPALIITGDTAPERLREAQASGHMLMNKPVPPGRLRAFLRTVRRNQAEGSLVSPVRDIRASETIAVN